MFERAKIICQTYPKCLACTCHCSMNRENVNKILVFRRKIQPISLKTFNLDCVIIFQGAYFLG